MLRIGLNLKFVFSPFFTVFFFCVFAEGVALANPHVIHFALSSVIVFETQWIWWFVKLADEYR